MLYWEDQTKQIGRAAFISAYVKMLFNTLHHNRKKDVGLIAIWMVELHDKDHKFCFLNAFLKQFSQD